MVSGTRGFKQADGWHWHWHRLGRTHACVACVHAWKLYRRQYEAEYRARHTAYARLNEKQARVVAQAEALQARADEEGAAAAPLAARK